MAKNSFIFTSESVSEGHPDKVCDQISDAILDAALVKDKIAKVACETTATTNLVMNLGEVRAKKWDEVNTEQIARNVVARIGYTKEEYKFCNTTFNYLNHLHGQSNDIAQGIEKQDEEIGAGDQGMMFGYATLETKELMPAPVIWSHHLVKHFANLRKSGKISFLRPDAKTQISMRYINSKPEKIESIVLSHQTDDIPAEEIKSILLEEIKHFFTPHNLLTDDTRFYINPTGKFVIGGPHGDAGLTGRKIIVDTYGGAANHGGGAFSGKDPSKVDRSAAYYARYAAKNIVAAGLAENCEIQVAYAIGVTEPVSININTFGNGKVPDDKLADFLLSGNLFNFTPAAIIKELQLRTPIGWKYEETAAYGHFGNLKFPWEKLNLVEALQKKWANFL